MSFTKEEVVKASLEYFNGDQLATDVFVNKYALKNDDEYFELTPNDMWGRITDGICSIENKYKNPVSYKEMFNSFNFNKLCPGGSILFGVGNPYVITSFANCFVLAGPEDNMSCIFNKARDMANISKRRGGVGIPLSTLRPEGAKVRNAAKTSSGAWSWGNFFSEAVRTVGQNSRRAALIETMDVSHPDIFKFINMKQNLKDVTGANISVLLSDDFMNAVKEDKDWDLIYKGKVYQTVKAKNVWKEIVKCATKTAEPGIIFWDTYCNNVPLHFYPDNEIVGVNPCSELALSHNSSCRLLSINLISFVKNPHTEDAYFDIDDYIKHVRLGVRTLDDIIDLELEALQKIVNSADTQDEQILFSEIYKKTVNDRRIGLGTFGLADCLAALRLKYDSDEALDFIKNIYWKRFYNAYDESVELAKERGAFPIFDSSYDIKSPIINKLTGALTRRMEEYGRRNGALLTDPPTGSISILFQVSSGIEPVFANSYMRRRKLSAEDDIIPDFIDEKGDKWQHYKVIHKNVQEYMEMYDLKDESELPNWFITADKIDWEKRIKIQGLISGLSDGGTSSCIAEGTLIQTNRGLFKIEELVGNDVGVGEFGKINIHNLKSINKDNEESDIIQCYNNGLSLTKTFVFEGGRDICCTLDHKLCVLDKNYKLIWKQARYIEEGDWFVFRRKLKLYNKYLNMQSLNYLNNSKFEYTKYTNSKQIKLPKYMTKELARLLGYLCSDGYAGKNGVGLTQLPNNVCDDFIKIIKSLFDLDCSISVEKRSDSGLQSMVVNSRELSSFFKWLGITDHNNIGVPICIRRAGKEAQQEFIKGATLDGHVNDGRTIIVATSTSLQYLRQLQLMLSNMGIEGTINVCNKEGDEREFPGGNISKCKQGWTLQLAEYYSKRYMASIGFAEERKNKEIEGIIGKYSRCKCSGSIPDFDMRFKFRKEILHNIKSEKLNNIFHSLTCKDARDQSWMRRETVREFVDMGFVVPGYLIDDTYDFRPVKSIIDSGLKQTYDLSVPNGNSYIANGVVSHNTINLPKGTTADTVEQIYMKAWEEGCKGITVYVEGSRDGILVRDNPCTKNYIRPKELPCEIFHETVQHHNEHYPFILIVGLRDGEPFEVFGGEAQYSELKKSHTKGIIKKEKEKSGSRYELVVEDGAVVWSLGEAFNANVFEPINRLISLSLRNGAGINFVVDQLNRCRTADLFAYAKVAARVLKKYVKDGQMSDNHCPECKEKTLKYEGGCMICVSCGYSGCG